MTSQYENKVVHPAVGQWLTDHGYTWQHEVRIPVGRIDFLATHSDEHKLIVECKIESETSRAALRQLLDYQLYLGEDHFCALAMPSWAINEKVKKACEVRNVTLIAVDVPHRESTSLCQPNEVFLRNMETLSFVEKMFRSIRRYVGEITRFHQRQGSNPTNDLLRAEHMCDLYIKGFNILAKDMVCTSAEYRSVFGEAHQTLEERPYQSLKDLVEYWGDIESVRSLEYKELTTPFIDAYGVVPQDKDIEFKWQAERKAEFYAMAWMVDAFDIDDDGVFYDNDGNIVSGDLNWEGSAHSFENASDWKAWKSSNRKSYFDQYDALRPIDLVTGRKLLSAKH